MASRTPKVMPVPGMQFSMNGKDWTVKRIHEDEKIMGICEIGNDDPSTLSWKRLSFAQWKKYQGSLIKIEPDNKTKNGSVGRKTSVCRSKTKR